MTARTNEQLADAVPPQPRAKSWSVRRAVLTGALAGAFFGLIFFAAYGLSSAWICSGLRACPGHWAPFVIVSTIGWGGSIMAGAFTGWMFRRLYEMFRVV